MLYIFLHLITSIYVLITFLFSSISILTVESMRSTEHPVLGTKGKAYNIPILKRNIHILLTFNFLNKWIESNQEQWK